MIIQSTTLETEEQVIAIYGGTSWSRLDDKFLVGAGTSYKVNGTGGEAKHTITTSELPSHNHTVTAKGSISGGAYTFTGSAVTSGNNSVGHTHTVPNHTHGLNGHTHSFSATTSSDGAHQHDAKAGSTSYAKWQAFDASGTYNLNNGVGYSGTASDRALTASAGSHTHSVSGTTGGNSGSTSSSGSCTTGGVSANHTHSVTAAGSVSVKTNPTFTGSSATSSSTGSGTAMNNLPPYKAVYIWERTA